MLEQFTYGKTTCAINLVGILNELGDVKITRTTSRFLAENNKIIHALSQITDNDVQKTLTGLFRKSILETNINVPEKIKTHAINVLISRMRDNIYSQTK